MKKLMVALAAVATAFGLFADGPSYTFLSGSDFESGELSTTYWKSSVEGAATVVDSQHGITDAMNIKRSLQYVGSTDTKGLKIATTLGNPVTNNVESTGLPLTLEGNLCYDALVNFTVFDATDEIPAVDLADAKLAVYLQLASEADDAATNLYVYAKNGGTAQAFQCATEVTPGWHRLTIKAIKNIGGNQPGFVVFIDGDAVKSEAAILTGTAAAALNVIAAEYNRLGKLFVSTSTTAEITSVCFDGQGSVDEAYFATGSVAAFTDDPATFTLAIGTGITSFTAKYGDQEKTWTSGSPAPEFVFGAAGKLVLSNVVCTDGKFLKTTEFDVDGNTITIPNAVVAVASIDETKYDDLNEAVAAASSKTLKLLADATNLTIAANMTLDLNARTIAGFSTEEDVEIVLTNSAVTDAIVDGGAFDAVGSIDVTSIKFDYTANYDEFAENKCGLQLVPTGAAADYEFVQGTGADSIYWVLQPKPIEVETPTAVTGLVYNGNAQTGVANDADKYESITGNTETNAGDYEAEITLKSGYAWKDETFDGKVKWSIAKADTTITTAPTASAEIEKGAALSTITLVGGVGSVAGAFDWTAPETKVDADGEYEVTFKPTDATNYKTATCMVSVKVKADVPGWVPAGKEGAYKTYAAKYKDVVPDLKDEGDLLDAFLLDAAPTAKALEDARKEFTITSITQGENGDWVVEPTGAYKNGTIEVKRYKDVGCQEKDQDDNGNFFKLQLK